MEISFSNQIYRYLLGPLRAAIRPTERKREVLAEHLALLRPDVLARHLEANPRPPTPGDRATRCLTTAAHYRALRSGMLAHFFELATIDAAEVGIEPRFPFCDRELVEYCLALPAEAKLRNGWGRAVMRDGLNGILTDTVRLRGGKSNLGHVFRRGLLHFERERLVTDLARGRDRLAEYLDTEALAATLQRYLRGEQHLAMVIWRPLVLVLWLEWRDSYQKMLMNETENCN
jgi:asparagine synthetase B (glutamine-hydrolysing)